MIVMSQVNYDVTMVFMMS